MIHPCSRGTAPTGESDETATPNQLQKRNARILYPIRRLENSQHQTKQYSTQETRSSHARHRHGQGSWCARWHVLGMTMTTTKPAAALDLSQFEGHTFRGSKK